MAGLRLSFNNDQLTYHRKESLVVRTELYPAETQVLRGVKKCPELWTRPLQLGVQGMEAK